MIKNKKKQPEPSVHIPIGVFSEFIDNMPYYILALLIAGCVIGVVGVEVFEVVIQSFNDSPLSPLH